MHHVCPKGVGRAGSGSGADSSGVHHIDGDDVEEDLVESEKMALLKKWPLPPQPPAKSDNLEHRKSMDAPPTMSDQNTTHFLLMQQQQNQAQANAAMAMATMRRSEDGIGGSSMHQVACDTEKQRYRKARDPKKITLATAASVPPAAAATATIVSGAENDDAVTASSAEEGQGRQKVQTEPEDLSNKESNELKSNPPIIPIL